MSTVKADYLVNAAGTGAPTLTNGAVLPAGSAAAPAISPTGDSNTGIFFPAADTIAFSEGGVEAMRIDSSGNVGIGVTSGGAKLDVVATGSGTAAQFSGGGTYQGFAIKNNQSSASVYGGTYYDARNELGAAVANFLADINTDGSSAWSWSTQAAGTRTDRRVERMRVDGSGNLLFNSGYGSVATAYGCRAWVKFNSAGGVNGSGNVTSVTNNAVGSFTINFTTAMPDTNYAAVGSCGNTDVAGDEEIVFFPSTRIGTSTLGYRVSSGGGAAASVAVNYVAVFR